jgi:hypothetical protein
MHHAMMIIIRSVMLLLEILNTARGLMGACTIMLQKTLLQKHCCIAGKQVISATTVQCHLLSFGRHAFVNPRSML